MPLLASDTAARAMAPSLADDMETRQVWTYDNPKYMEYTARFTEKLDEIYAREAQRVRSANVAVVTQPLDTAEFASLTKMFPEFALQGAALSDSVSAKWTAARGLVNTLMRTGIHRHATKVLHVGDDLVMAALEGDEDVMFELDPTVAVAQHEALQASINLMRLASDPKGMKQATGVTISAAVTKKFLDGELYHRSGGGVLSGVKADGVVVDGTLYPVSVSQVLYMMLQAGAEVGVVTVPFDPVMLLKPEGGEIPDMGVHYEVTPEALLLKYPKGVAGLTRFPLTAWHEWLAASHRVVPWGGGKAAFCFELRRPRGPFLEISIVRVADDTPAPSRSLHTLELCDTKGKTMLRGWRLRALGLDVTKAESWQSFTQLYDEAIVQKITELALSLPVGELHVHKLVSRAHAIGRTIVSGTGVETRPSLTADEVRDLCVQVHAWAYVKRYEAGTHMGDIKQKLDLLCGFSKLTRGQRFMYLLTATAEGYWDALVGESVKNLRAWMDRTRDWFAPNRAAEIVEFAPVPEFITFEQARDNWMRCWYTWATKLRANDYVLDSLRGTWPAQVNSLPVVRAPAAMSEGIRTGEDVLDYYDMREGECRTEEIDKAVSAVREVADLHQEPQGLHVLEVAGTRPVVDNPDEYSRPSYFHDEDYVTTLSEFHESIFPGYSGQNFQHDDASLSLDPQDRALATDFLSLPADMPRLPADRAVYKSRVQAYNREKAAQTLTGTLAALMVRNMADPQLAKGQDVESLIPAIFDNFLQMACVPDAKAKLARYQREAVTLTDETYASWAAQAKPDALKSLRGQLEAQYKSFEERDVGSYIAMLKADMKPPLSTKPLRERVEPQVIVYHEKVLSSLYSSMFRVIRERLLSLLKPNFKLVLMKGPEEIREFMRDNHPWDAEDLQFLENDFSKYDKSQGEFAFLLEEYIFRQLGLNEEMLERWVGGHVKCSIRAFSIGLTMHVMYQRKSGDATTALGNVILNICSVLYAYSGTDIKWAVFMGDDSLACVGRTVVAKKAPQILAEIFNLQAKFYVTGYPYFASNFVLFDHGRRDVVMVPDPVKIIQRWSLSVPERDPRWEERWVSADESYNVYRYRHKLEGLGPAVRNRYAVSPQVKYDFGRIGSAIASAIHSLKNFRKLREDKVTVVRD